MRGIRRTRVVAAVAAALVAASVAIAPAAMAAPANEASASSTPTSPVTRSSPHPEVRSETKASDNSNELRSEPAAPEPVILLQPDGATFSAVPWGIATFNGYEDAQGYTVQKDAGGVWRYLGIDANGGAALSGDRPDKGPPPSDVQPHLRPARPSPDVLAPEAGAIPQSTFVPFTGNSPDLIILAQFTDQASVGTTPASWAQQFFGATSSVSDFYDEMSYGKLAITPASESSGTANDGVVGWVTLPINHPNTGSLDSEADYAAAHNTVRQAIIAADPYVNFAAYDTNGNGVIEPRELHITVIAAGYETAYGGEAAQCGNSVWGHRWAIGGHSVTAPTVDGKTAGSAGYMLFGEQHCTSSNPPGHHATIGIMAHELGHDFNFPDLYDTDFSSEGIGNWSLMAGGSWNYTAGQYQGATPAGLDPFTRTYQDWVTPAQIGGSDVTVPLGQVETNQRIVRLLDNPNGIDWNFNSQSGTGQYFLIENRQKVGYDAGLPGCGVLIWHVDETRSSGSGANANDSDRLIDLEEADGLNQMDSAGHRGDAGDPYPGTSGNTAFNDTSNPNSKLIDGTASGVSVTVPAGGCASSVDVNVTAPGSSTNGYLRVTTTPAVPSQITVDGNVADTWGLQWVKSTPGSHLVCFGAVAGFTTPACQTVTVSPGLTTSVDGAFTQRGYLQVSTSPAVAAQISVDGIPRDNWGLYTDLPAGSHQVCYGAVAGFTPPGCQTVAVTAGSTTSVTGTFAPSAGTGLANVGQLRVTTSPALPSQITVDGNIADTWGLNWLEIASGSHTVCFTRVEGYTTPSCQTVSVANGATTVVTGTFVQRGFLKVVTSPAVAGTISINGNPADDWGVFTDLPVGTYNVCFGAVVGKTAPACQSRSVTAGTTNTTTGTYT